MRYKKELEVVLQEIMTRWDVPGMAIGIVEGNEIIHVYPEFVESYLEQARFYLYKGETAPAKECILKALSIEPENITAARLLEMIHH